MKITGHVRGLFRLFEHLTRDQAALEQIAPPLGFSLRLIELRLRFAACNLCLRPSRFLELCERRFGGAHLCSQFVGT